jgi:hypothetical protein
MRVWSREGHVHAVIWCLDHPGDGAWRWPRFSGDNPAGPPPSTHQEREALWTGITPRDKLVHGFLIPCAPPRPRLAAGRVCPPHRFRLAASRTPTTRAQGQGLTPPRTSREGGTAASGSARGSTRGGLGHHQSRSRKRPGRLFSTGSPASAATSPSPTSPSPGASWSCHAKAPPQTQTLRSPAPTRCPTRARPHPVLVLTTSDSRAGAE